MHYTRTDLEKSLLFSEELKINLRKADEDELFKWFLASILFGARISETIAKNTYKTFERYKLLDPKKIIDAGLDFLVNPIMREGGYVRYDYKTAKKINTICNQLFSWYGGKITNIHQMAQNSADLERRIMEFYGIGPVTVNIFLRELRPFWNKANPVPRVIVIRIAKQLHIDLIHLNRKSISFVRIEAGLIRLRKRVLHNKTA